MAGRPPKPPHLRDLHGTHDASRHGAKGAAVVSAVPNESHKTPSAPSWLTGNAKREWRRICKEMGELADGSARAIMAQYCFMYSRLQEEPHAFSAGDHAQFIRMQVELGLTPAAKAKLRPPEPPRDNDDPDGWKDL